VPPPFRCEEQQVDEVALVEVAWLAARACSAAMQLDGMEHEVEDPRAQQDHRHQDGVTVVHEPDVDGPGRWLGDLDLRAMGAHVDDDSSGRARIGPDLKAEGHHGRARRAARRRRNCR
jgi:hypothetical protein